MARDEEPRTIKIPDDLAAALKTTPSVRELFDKLSYSHQREYVNWINAAKKEPTRANRIAKTIEKITGQ